MNDICKLIYPGGLMLDCVISSVLAMEMLRSCTEPSVQYEQWPGV